MCASLGASLLLPQLSMKNNSNISILLGQETWHLTKINQKY